MKISFVFGSHSKILFRVALYVLLQLSCMTAGCGPDGRRIGSAEATLEGRSLEDMGDVLFEAGPEELPIDTYLSLLEAPSDDWLSPHFAVLTRELLWDKLGLRSFPHAMPVVSNALAELSVLVATNCIRKTIAFSRLCGTQSGRLEEYFENGCDRAASLLDLCLMSEALYGDAFPILPDARFSPGLDTPFLGPGQWCLRGFSNKTFIRMATGKNVVLAFISLHAFLVWKEDLGDPRNFASIGPLNNSDFTRRWISCLPNFSPSERFRIVEARIALLNKSSGGDKGENVFRAESRGILRHWLAENSNLHKAGAVNDKGNP